ncbi:MULTISPECIES: CDGSH iron-sulfur domain-containing protein [Prauserella]|uniref:Iron-binding zinc finger CDGSH type domain-containing protein n=2 Tax=Prauserella TaxID=142577 RepID=A0A318L8N4_9PSEU|nr:MULTISPECIES: CDGSH iron-sulfur domain-containing protein [Prauserella]PXY16680.1 hypothetical protein BAY59_38305 [Prauserella coralliicola]PXY16881.1 hypothetical protein BA062_38285 [Prauserella flavalba]RBM15253.1 CDGSH iron-sulfur domain-containing protein [Prauserella sp. PE36]TKG58257.1 CDGSH iron-sulfur domain-containing protein [Prauserella endophytica]
MSTEPSSDRIVVKAVDNGPYQIKGPIRLVDHENNSYELGPGRTTLLCRCGMSAKKPFCDGSHARNGFNATERST